MSLLKAINTVTDCYSSLDALLKDSDRLTTDEFDYLHTVNTNLALILARLMKALRDEGNEYISIR